LREKPKEESWFVGAITDENARKSEIKLDLTRAKYKTSTKMLKMPTGKKPIAYKIKMIVVTIKIDLNLAPGGGTAISFELMK
jgi:hypothetical protein